MPLNIICSKSNRRLWSAFLERTLPALAHAGPKSHPAQVWLTHRIQRDLLLEAAAERGLRGWLNPPIRFFSGLPEIFGIEARPIGLLARRELISSIGYQVGRRYGIHIGNADATITRGNMLDAFFGELLPEGVTTDALRAALAAGMAPAPAGAPHDEFAARRNAWVVECYEDYRKQLEARGLYDARAIHARIADRIDAGALRGALEGAPQLHIYGVYSARSRMRLLQALARQADVDAVLYTAKPVRDLARFASAIVDVDREADPDTAPRVQPAPDSNREVQWIAREVKRLIHDGAEPHEIAVIARTGRVDTRRAVQALERAGVPATARERTPLSEISALKAVLDLFRAAAHSWTYRPLRAVLASPYLGTRIDLRPFDRIAADARPASLAEWADELGRLETAVAAQHDPDARRMGISVDRLAQVIARFAALRPLLERLDEPKVAAEWLNLTKELLRDRRFRQRICRAPLDRYDIVRLDQRGVHQLERILSEWLDLDEPSHRMTPSEWYRSLRVLLESQELVLTTPGQKGVQVLEAHDAALIPFRATFIMHANDGEFPQPFTPTGLFGEEERIDLERAGLPVDCRASVLRRERALWDAITGGDNVAITYRTTDPAGTPLLPSLLVPAHSPETELPRTNTSITTPVNAEESIRAAAALVARAMRSQPVERIAVPDPPALRHALLNAHAETMRGAPDRRGIENPVNPWNGYLRDPSLLARIGERFNDDYAWSASQLESYAAAPFVFLLDRVLNLRELEEAEEDTSALAFGSVAHDVLEGFYRALAGGLPPAFDAAAERTLATVAERVFAERGSQREWLGAPILWREQQRRIREMLAEYLAWELGYLSAKRERPVRFEHVLGGNAPIVLRGADVHGNTVAMRVAGRIDRIDADEKGVHHVLDYKSGSIPTASGYNDGATLQAPLYLEALRACGMTVGKARYRSLKSPGKPQNGAEVKLDDGKFRHALAIAFTIPARVREGRFEATAAESTKWKRYHPDLSVRRTNAIVEGSRFDG